MTAAEKTAILNFIRDGVRPWKAAPERREEEKMNKKKVAFLCVHNSCRSQIAEALGHYLAEDVFESYSAGTATKPRIDPAAVRLMRELYGIDMEARQFPKTVDQIPEPDIAISMGCDVGCPYVGRELDDNWQLEDPTGRDDDAYREVIDQIQQCILALRMDLK